MKYPIISIVLTMVVLGLAGCGEEPSVTTPAVNADPGADKDPPETSGPLVHRSESTYWILMGDTEDVIITIGIDPELLAQGIMSFEVIPLQYVANPQEQELVNAMLHGDFTVAVWPGEGFTGWPDFIGRECLAVGTCTLTATDNNFYGWMAEPRNSSWGFRINGPVTAPSDEVMQLHAGWRFAYRDGVFDIRSYGYHLTPAH